MSTTGGGTGIITATAFSGPINGSIGATTPSTGAFTSQSTSYSSTGYGSGTAGVIITNTNTAPQACLAIIAPNMATTTDIDIMLGQSTSIGNSAQIYYKYVGNNSSSNQISIGFYGGGGSQLILNNSGTGASLNVPLAVGGIISSTSTPTASFNIDAKTSLTFSANNANNKIIALYDQGTTDTLSTATNFYGFGINSATLRYQAPATGTHKWYTSTTNTMGLDNSGNLTTIGTATIGGNQSIKIFSVTGTSGAINTTTTFTLPTGVTTSNLLSISGTISNGSVLVPFGYLTGDPSNGAIYVDTSLHVYIPTTSTSVASKAFKVIFITSS
jgi:uncharacterized protein (UPF0333 family)